jgi:hypothetical protein
MKNVIELLLNLQTLEMGPLPNTPANTAEIRRLRQKIFPQIIAHYDRLRARDKKGVALVRHGVCTECHMRLASGIYAELIRAEDIIICDSCSRYLILAKEEPPAPTASTPPSPPTKPAPKRRKKKTPPPDKPGQTPEEKT